MKLNLLTKRAATKSDSVKKVATASRGLRVRSAVQAGGLYFGLPGGADYRVSYAP